MKKENKNDSSILIVIITLLSFILGVVSSTFIKEIIEEIRLAFLRFMEVNHTFIVWSLIGVTTFYFFLVVAFLPPPKKKSSQKEESNPNSGSNNNSTKDDQQKKEEDEAKRKEEERIKKEKEEQERRQKDEEAKRKEEERIKKEKEEQERRQKDEEAKRKEEEKAKSKQEEQKRKDEESKKESEAKDSTKEKYQGNSFFSLKVESIISRIETAQKGWEIFKTKNMDKHHLYAQIFSGFVEEFLVLNEKENKRIYRKLAKMFHPEGDNSGKIDGKVLESTFQKLTNVYKEHYNFYFSKKNM